MKDKTHRFAMTKIALAWVLLYSSTYLAGLSTYVSVWSGTLVGDINDYLAGLGFIVLYLGMVCIVPTLILADALLWLRQSWLRYWSKDYQSS